MSSLIGTQRIWALGIVLSAFATLALADVVTMKNGNTFEGVVLNETPDRVLMRLAYGTVAIPKKDVESVSKTSSEKGAEDGSASSRLPPWNRCLDLVAKRPWASALQQIPATVVDAGSLRYVPYQSHKAGDYEFNIYGDPDKPAGIEMGVYGKLARDPRARQECLGAMSLLLTDKLDRQFLKTLELEGDLKKTGGLTFETTPDTAKDAYGAWWISIYDEEAIDEARATKEDLKVITVLTSSVKESGGSFNKESQATAGSVELFGLWSSEDIKQARPQAEQLFKQSAKKKDSTEPRPSASPTAGQERALPERVYVRGYYRQGKRYASVVKDQAHSAKAVAGPGSASAPKPKVALLRDGQRLEYISMKALEKGVFVIHTKGARLFDWADLAPASLPEDVRDVRRPVVVEGLKGAEALYQKGEYDAAAREFQAWQSAVGYLAQHDAKNNWAKDVDQKAKGLVPYKDEWVTPGRRAELVKKEAEEERLRAEREAEEKRRLAEKEAEEERRLAEKKAEEKRRLAEKEAEEKRRQAEKEAEEKFERAQEAKGLKKWKGEWVSKEEFERVAAGQLEGQVGIQLGSGQVVFMAKGAVYLFQKPLTYRTGTSRFAELQEIENYENLLRAISEASRRGEMLYTVKTDFQGNYQFRDIPEGEYYIACSWDQGINHSIWTGKVSIKAGHVTTADLTHTNVTEYYSSGR